MVRRDLLLFSELEFFLSTNVLGTRDDRDTYDANIHLLIPSSEVGFADTSAGFDEDAADTARNVLPQYILNTQKQYTLYIHNNNRCL